MWKRDMFCLISIHMACLSQLHIVSNIKIQSASGKIRTLIWDYPYTPFVHQGQSVH